MKFRSWIVLFVLFATCAPVDAQSVSGLSTKPTPAISDPAPVKADNAGVKTIIDLANALATATVAQRTELMKTLNNLTHMAETGANPVNLAVPAGATASVGENGEPAAGARLGFQAWKPDDFFAGAFFTFDAAPTLNGDLRKAGQFLRDPPNAGTSFFVTANRMFKRYRCGGFMPVRWDEDETPSDPCDNSHGDRRDAVIIGLSGRAGATTTALEHKPSEEGATVERHEAAVLHVSLYGLLTSRTFRTEDGGEYQFGLELGPTLRKVVGDATQHPDFLAHPDVFGHSDTLFGGVDGTFFARLNGFQPFVRVTYIPDRGGLHVPGLTGAQASFGITVQSALFQTAKEPPERKPDSGGK